MGRCAVREGGLLQLLALAMQNPCFEELRTKQQLGYIVFSGVMKENPEYPEYTLAEALNPVFDGRKIIVGRCDSSCSLTTVPPKSSTTA